jgi:hypothetical protein
VATNASGHGAKSAAVRERAILGLLSENSITAVERCGRNEKPKVGPRVQSGARRHGIGGNVESATYRI